MLEKYFSIDAHKTTFQKEVLAGVTTFITMAYIIFVNPQMMAQSGMDHGAIFVGTCLAAAIACFVMGLFANNMSLDTNSPFTLTAISLTLSKSG